MGDIPIARSDDVSLVAVEARPGLTAWRSTEPDAPGLFALVYDACGMKVPDSPETDTMTFVLFEEGVNAPIGNIEIHGRAGLNFWYLTHVGHEPDKEPDGPLPITHLITNVAGHLMLRYFEEGLAPDAE